MEIHGDAAHAGKYSSVEEEFENLPEKTHAELIDGVIYYMATASPLHQDICGGVYVQLRQYLRGKRCKALQDVGVKFSETSSNTFEPDLIIVCDPSKIDMRRLVHGVPDMIMEAVSPSNIRHDIFVKMKHYRNAEVSEYWIAYPDQRVLQVFTLVEDRYVVQEYGATDKVKVGVLDDCVIDLSEVFPPEEETSPDT